MFNFILQFFVQYVIFTRFGSFEIKVYQARLREGILSKHHDSTSILKTLAGKLDINRHSPSILYLQTVLRQKVRYDLNQKSLSLVIFLKFYFERVSFERNQQVITEQAKSPSMQR